jgi:hypothetical protein
MALLPFFMQIIDVLDFYRRAMFAEDGGDSLDYVAISGLADFILLGFQSAPYLLMKPFLWEASNILQLIQSVENIFLFVFLALFFWKASKLDAVMTLKWILFLFVALTIYGLVVFNFGTAVRYKFPFIVMVVVGLTYDLYKRHGLFIMRRKK